MEEKIDIEEKEIAQNDAEGKEKTPAKKENKTESKKPKVKKEDSVFKKEMLEGWAGFKAMSILQKTAILSLVTVLFLTALNGLLGYWIETFDARRFFAFFKFVSLLIALKSYALICFRNKKVEFNGLFGLFVVTVIACL